MKIVLDTNCLLVIVPKKSPYRILFDLIISGKIKLIVTSEILFEYEELLGRFYSVNFANLIINILVNLPNVVKVESIYFNWLLIPHDIDDNKFIDAYIAGGAEYLISNDRHFDVAKQIKFPEIKCIKLKEFIRVHI